MKPVLIIGAGGHAKVVADALLASGRQVLGFVGGEPLSGVKSEVLLGIKVLGTEEVLRNYSAIEVDLVNGLGGVDCSGLRRRVQERLEGEGWYFSGVRHPSALVSPFSDVSPSVQILAASVVQVGASIGGGSILNTAAVVEHDSVLGSYVHVAPRAVICGNSRVGCNSHVGVGAIVRQGLQLGPDTLVGAGAVVVKDFDGRGALIGVPAKQGISSK